MAPPAAPAVGRAAPSPPARAPAAGAPRAGPVADRQRGPQSGGLPLVARDIVWRAVFSFRARDIERGPRCLLLCAAVIRALLRARRISFVRGGGSRDQHDKGGRTYHRIILPGGDLFARPIAGTFQRDGLPFRGRALVCGSSHVSKRAAIQRRITEFRPSNVRAKSPAPRGLWPDARGTARSPPGRGRGDVSSPATPPAAEPSLPRRAWALTAPSRIGGRLLRRVVGHCSSSEAAYSSGPLGSGSHRTCRSTSPRLPSRSVHQRMPKQCCTTP